MMLNEPVTGDCFFGRSQVLGLLEKRVNGRREHLKKVKEEYEEARNKLNTGVSKEMSLTQESGYLNKRIGEITDSRSRLEKEQEQVTLKIEDLIKDLGIYRSHVHFVFDSSQKSLLCKLFGINVSCEYH